MSRLSSGKMYKKNDIYFECIGMIEELNVRIGSARYHTQMLMKHETELYNFLIQIQQELMCISGLLSTEKEEHESDDAYLTKLKKPGQFMPLERLEKVIDGICEMFI